MGELLHALQARLALPPRFAATHCSQCGTDLGPGNNGVSSCSDHKAPWPIKPYPDKALAYPAGMVQRRRTLAERTQHMPCMLVSIGEHADADVRYQVTDDGIELRAVRINSAWVDPDTVFLPTLINCICAEINCELVEEEDHQRTVAAHMGAL
jgi:hypothetical protein